MIVLQALDKPLAAMIEAGKIDPPDGWPLDPSLQADIRDIAVGKELGVPALDVARLPLHWVGAALTRLEAERQMNERQASKSKKGR